jgi:general secretion pathway protein C
MALTEIASKLVEPARWLVIAGIAFTLANTVLFFVVPPESEGVQPRPEQVARTPDRRGTVSVSAIVSRNLFGVAGDTASTPVDNELPAVETRLPLELQAVYEASDPEASFATVAQKGRPGENYGVGQVLPGNAELLEVHSDHIVLRRAGGRETLRFPEVVRAPDLTPVEYEEPVDEDLDQADATPWRDGAQSPRDFVASYRDRLDEDPDGTLQEIGLSPVAKGEAQGYRLDSVAADSPYLSQTGLQPGDVVLSVNGQPVGNIQQDRQQLDNILAQGSARIEVQRGTRRFFVTASLNQ